MPSKTERAARPLPDVPESERLHRRALSRGVSRTTAAHVHSSPGQGFYLPACEAVARRTGVHVAGKGVAQ